ncbi:MAG: DUF2752 domain-containing protein [Bacteroidota bacterium]
MKKAVPYYFELSMWCIALVFFIINDPHAVSSFFLCPLHNLGYNFCPGCGLGHSLSLFIHGYIAQSFSAHPLGIPAAFILLHRNLTLIQNITEHKTLLRSTF